MNIRSYPLYLLLSCALVVSLTACDQSSQKIEFSDGSNLTVDGPARLVLEGYQSGPGIAADTATGEYMVSAYTIKQEYSWAVANLAGRDVFGSPGDYDYARRGGEEGQSTKNPEVVGERSTNPRTYQVQVTTTIDGKDYTGSAVTKVDYPNASSQLTAGRKLSLAATLLNQAGLVGVLDADDTPPNRWTAFLPETDALTAALDASGNGSIEAEELPAPGVLQKVLLYHVAADSLTASDVAGESPSTLLHPNETLSLSGTGVTATNGSGTFQLVDIPSSDGIIHSIDGVLLPNSVVSLQNQTVLRGGAGNTDTVRVEGTYVHDGGFVALHDGASGNIIGTSDYLDPGFHGNVAPIPVELNSQRSDSSAVVAMPHRDTNGNQTFDFSGGSTDKPYFRGNSSVAVTDTAGVDVPQ